MTWCNRSGERTESEGNELWIDERDIKDMKNKKEENLTQDGQDSHSRDHGSLSNLESQHDNDE